MKNYFKQKRTRNFYDWKIKNQAKSGFTIIEVTLAMAFIGALLIAIAMVLINIFSIYQKSLTVKSIDSVGRGIVSELTTTINAAPSIDSTSLCGTLGINCTHDDDVFNNFIYHSRSGTTHYDETTQNNIQLGGVLCTGNYTYVWNTYHGYHSGYDGHGIKLRYYSNSEHRDVDLENFKMIKFTDRNYRACTAIAKNPTAFQNNGEVDIRYLPNGAQNFTETPQTGFLSSTDVDLYLYELTIFPVSQDAVTLRAFFSGTFILATDRGDVNIMRTGDYCNPNAVVTENGESGATGDILDLGSEFNYCAVNKFNFAARTTGKNSV